MANPILQKIVDSGCVTVLRTIFDLEQKLVATLSIDDLADFYEMKSTLHIHELAVFHWYRRTSHIACVTFRRQPRLCRDMVCQMHTSCAVCQSEEHSAIEVYGGVATTHCTVVRRVAEELQMLRNCWNVTGTELFYYFQSLCVDTDERTRIKSE